MIISVSKGRFKINNDVIQIGSNKLDAILNTIKLYSITRKRNDNWHAFELRSDYARPSIRTNDTSVYIWCELRGKYNDH